MGKAVPLKFQLPQANRQERQITMMVRKSLKEVHNQKSKKIELKNNWPAAFGKYFWAIF